VAIQKKRPCLPRGGGGAWGGFLKTEEKSAIPAHRRVEGNVLKNLRLFERETGRGIGEDRSVTEGLRKGVSIRDKLDRGVYHLDRGKKGEVSIYGVPRGRGEKNRNMWLKSQRKRSTNISVRWKGQKRGESLSLRERTARRARKEAGKRARGKWNQGVDPTCFKKRKGKVLLRGPK